MFISTNMFIPYFKVHTDQTMENVWKHELQADFAPHRVAINVFTIFQFGDLLQKTQK